MQPNEKKAWFPTKRYGWGWGPPCSWQGWVVLVIWAIMIFVGLLHLKNHPVISIIYLFVLIIALLIVCLLKGEKPHWRWGKD